MYHIRPMSDLRNHTNEILELCHEENQPVFITRNGRGDSVIMSLTHYEQMQNLLQLYQKLSEAEAQDAAGEQGITHAEMMAQLKAKLA
ncbi:MAG: type II toxin-antitoxin system Phd/YefM family antitoxin [Caldilineaceae bacterium]